VSRISRGTPEADAYLDLKNRAQREKRPTQELLQLYVLEAFLSRLAASDLRDRFVLKGACCWRRSTSAGRRETSTSLGSISRTTP
jgi:hypothetical protein